MDSMVQDSDIIADSGYGGALIALYLFDETAERLAIQEVDNQSVVVGLSISITMMRLWMGWRMFVNPF